MTARCYLLTASQFQEAENRRIDLATTRSDGLKGAALYEVLRVGAMWFCPTLYNPADPDHDMRRRDAIERIRQGKSPGYLSRFYWQDWSATRPPISVLCPNGIEWCVDAKSSNGEGWKVIGEPPMLVVRPSIDVTGYHGFLGTVKPGVFGADVTPGRPPGGLLPQRKMA